MYLGRETCRSLWVVADNPTQRVLDERQRISNMFALGKVPKAEFVVPEAVQKHREARAASSSTDRTEGDISREDVLLDLLIFLAGKRERAALFTVVE